jgi:SAM-dependent methyltransferase
MADAGFDYTSIPVGYYDQVYHRCRGIQSKWHRLKFARVAAEIAGLRRHLDIGCSAGTFIGNLGSSHDSIGLDLAEAQISYARQHYAGAGRAFMAVPAGPLPFDDGSFDAVTVIELIEHLPAADNLILLKEARRVLAVGGRVVVTTPNYGSLWPLLEAMVNRLGDVSYADQHITHYRRNTLAALLADAGFADVRVQGHMLAAPFVAPLGWRLADCVAACEPALLVDRCGFLLAATGCKDRA